MLKFSLAVFAFVAGLGALGAILWWSGQEEVQAPENRDLQSNAPPTFDPN